MKFNKTLTLTSGVIAQEPVWGGNKVVLEAEKLSNGIFAYYPTGAKKCKSKASQLQRVVVLLLVIKAC